MPPAPQGRRESHARQMSDRALVKLFESFVRPPGIRELPTRNHGTKRARVSRALTHERQRNAAADLIVSSQRLHVCVPQLLVREQRPHVGVREHEPIVQV